VARVTVEDCLDKVNNRFSLVHLVAKRSKQIMKGATTVVSHKDNKSVVTALREVAAGCVYYDTQGGQVDTEESIEAEFKLKKT
jgi:DNA-directed RNA polymerase subunit omega